MNRAYSGRAGRLRIHRGREDGRVFCFCCRCNSNCDADVRSVAWHCNGTGEICGHIARESIFCQGMGRMDSYSCRSLAHHSELLGSFLRPCFSGMIKRSAAMTVCVAYRPNIKVGSPFLPNPHRSLGEIKSPCPVRLKHARCG